MKYRVLFEARLVITFGRLETPTRAVKRSENKVYLRKSKEQYARCVYLEILEEQPSLYLPFILAVSPAGCRGFHAFEFLQYYNEQPIALPAIYELNNEARCYIRDISKKCHFEDNRGFMKLMSVLFPSTSSMCFPRPISAVETQKPHVYGYANRAAVHDLFGDYISEAVEEAPARTQEKATLAPSMTQCVKTTFSQREFKDAVIVLDIGRACKVAEVLFPTLVLPLSRNSEDSQAEQVRDNAHFTLKGASTAAMESVFSPRICEAIEASELRAWEKAHYLHDTTDCVTMKVFRAPPHAAFISVRLQYFSARPMLVELYSAGRPNMYTSPLLF